MERLLILLRPLSWLYSRVLLFRHRLYDLSYFKSAFGPLPTIVVGNLELGGTGKSPLTDYLINILKREHKIALLSRGYGRSSKGFLKIHSDSSAQDVGDEPLMMFARHPEVEMAVCEDRLTGLEELAKNETLDCVILDDAFQHRKLKSGFNLLVSPFQKPFWENQVIPEGTLRDVKKRARNAHAIVVSKCPDNLTEDQRLAMKEACSWYSSAPIFFTSLVYTPLVPLYGPNKLGEKIEEVLVVTGIADNTELIKQLKSEYSVVKVLSYKDHHAYSLSDAQDIKEIYSTFASRKMAVITTAKDAVKLKSDELEKVLVDLPIYFQPIELKFHGQGIEEMINGYVRANKRNR